MPTITLQTRWAHRADEIYVNVTRAARALDADTVYTPAYHVTTFGFDSEGIYFGSRDEDASVTAGLEGVSANVECYAWQSYLNGDMLRSLAKYIPISLTVGLQYQDLYGEVDYYTCTDKASVSTLVNGLVYASGAVQATCNDDEWFIQNCDVSAAGDGSLKTSALCIGEEKCADMDLCAPQASYKAGLFVSPCSSEHLIGVEDGIAYIVTGYKEFAPAPTLYSVDVIPTRTTLTVSVTTGMGEAGLLMCNAFVRETAAPSSAQKITSAQLITAVTTAHDTANGSAILVIPNLAPATDYSLYCMTESTEGVRSKLETALTDSNHRFHAHMHPSTQCCKGVAVTLQATDFIEGSTVAAAVKIDALAKPKEDITVSVRATRTNDSSVFTYFAPSSVHFSSGTPVADMSKILAFVAPEPSWSPYPFNLTVTITGTSAYQFDQTFTMGSAFNVLPNDRELPPPKFMSARFSNSLLQVRSLTLT